VKLLDVGAAGFRRIASEGFSRTFEQLGFPLNNRVGMNIETFGELGCGLIALDGGDRHLGLEGRRVVATGTLHDDLLLSRVSSTRSRQSHHITDCSANRSHRSDGGR
jgi:hypothetical protein